MDSTANSWLTEVIEPCLPRLIRHTGSLATARRVAKAILGHVDGAEFAAKKEADDDQFWGAMEEALRAAEQTAKHRQKQHPHYVGPTPEQRCGVVLCEQLRIPLPQEAEGVDAKRLSSR